MLKDLIIKNRSYRRFEEGMTVDPDTLRRLVDLARLSASGGNKQPLKYILSHVRERNALIFENLSWAVYLEDWPGPAEGERPSAYIVILGDTSIRETFGCDHGIAAQSILLGAAEAGLGGCIIGSVSREGLRTALEIPDRYEILLVIALGKPAEESRLEDVGSEGDIRYWRDELGVHHVPKRSLEEIIIG